MRPISRPAIVLSVLIAGFAAVASAGGQLIPGLYRDNTFVVSTWRGNDLVTLLVAVPLLVVSLLLSIRGSARAQLVWIGVLDYMLYNFGFYLFGSAFNLFFLVYAGLFAMSIWAIVYALVRLDIPALVSRFSPRTPVRSIAGFMLFVGLGLGTVYVLMWLGFATTAQVPSIVERTAHPTNVVFALDLSLVIPLLVVGGIWLWRRKPWGYVLSAVVNVKGVVYMLSLCAATLTAFLAGTIDRASEIGLWGAIGIGNLAALLVLLWNLKSET